MTMESTATVGRAGGGGHRRRSRWLSGKFLALFLSVATMLGGWAVIAPQFEQKAAAIDDGKDIVWDINGGQPAFNKMIDKVRQRATGGRVLREGVLQTDPTQDSTSDIFAVEVRHSGAASSSEAPRVRLIFKAKNLFLLGWHIILPIPGDLNPGASNAGGTLIWFKGDDPGYRGSNAEKFPPTVRNLNFTGNYTDLERVAGRPRSGLTLSGPVMEQAFRDIRASAERARTDTTADAAMVLIMTIAEAARFDPLQQAFAQGFATNNQYTITGNDARLMNSWSDISNQLVSNLNDRTPIDVSIRDNDPSTVDFLATTVSSVTAILAICLMQLKS